MNTASWSARLVSFARDLGLPRSRWRFLRRRGTASACFWVRLGDVWARYDLHYEGSKAVLALRKALGITEDPWPRITRTQSQMRTPIKTALRRARVPPWQYAWNGGREFWLDTGGEIKRWPLRWSNVAPILRAIEAIGKQEPYER